jgi:hypothetical protein
MFTTGLMQFDPILSENKPFGDFPQPQVLDRINDHMAQMPAVVEAHTSVATIFPFLRSFF